MQTRKFPGRSGKYIKQSEGYKAFIPEPLPPKNPELEINEDLLESLSRADRSLGRLDGSIQTLPNSNLFIEMYVKKEAVISSQIEGTQSSLSHLLKSIRIFDILKKMIDVNNAESRPKINEVFQES